MDLSASSPILPRPFHHLKDSDDLGKILKAHKIDMQLWAMPEEITLILTKLDAYETKEYANNSYDLGNYYGHKPIFVYSKVV